MFLLGGKKTRRPSRQKQFGITEKDAKTITKNGFTLQIVFLSIEMPSLFHLKGLPVDEKLISTEIG